VKRDVRQFEIEEGSVQKNSSLFKKGEKKKRSAWLKLGKNHSEILEHRLRKAWQNRDTGSVTGRESKSNDVAWEKAIRRKKSRETSKNSKKLRKKKPCKISTTRRRTKDKMMGGKRSDKRASTGCLHNVPKRVGVEKTHPEKKREHQKPREKVTKKERH